MWNIITESKNLSKGNTGVEYGCRDLYRHLGGGGDTVRCQCSKGVIYVFQTSIVDA